MKIDDAIETLAHFFNDFIGTWIPGVVMASGFIIMHVGGDGFLNIVEVMDKNGIIWFLVAVLFALGHLISAFYEHSLKKILQWLKFSKGFDEKQAKEQQPYKLFLEMFNRDYMYSDIVSWSYHDLRNVALSISQDASALGRRFMFISLLCRGVGTALVIIIVDFLICLTFAPDLLYHYQLAPHWLIQMIILSVSVCCLFKQSDYFYKIAMTTPFSVAFIEMKLKGMKLNEIK